ncbi:MAG TPA: c-type cytochrome [Terracidiphilus sp.]|nr:c-type cytochrome [Terracidiphilus sp.]
MTRRTFPILSIVLSATLALAAGSSSRWQHIPAKDHARPNPLAGNAEAVVAGALVYRDHCLECHRANAQGDGHKRPALRSDRIRTATDGDIEWFLRQGDLGHGMPSWSSLPAAQRWQVVAWLRFIQ